MFSFSFNPPDTGRYEDIATICYDIDTPELTQRIARQVTLKGYAYDNTGIGDNNPEEILYGPNPGNGRVALHKINVPLNSLRVLSPSGKIIYEDRTISGNSLNIDISDLPPGFYLINLETQEGNQINLKYLKIK
jgi:hypothetical protein